MKKLLVAGALTALFVSSVSANIVFDDVQVAIFGTGNPDGGWVTSYNPAMNLNMSLRAKDRLNGATPNNGAGTYMFSPGSYAGPIRAKWNWEFSINTDPAGLGIQKLDGFDFYLASSGPSLIIPTFDPVNNITDNSYGNNLTPNGGGIEGLAIMHASIYNIAQNSWNITFTGGDPDTIGDYLYTLYATAPGAGPDGQRLAEVSMVVSVPEPSSAALVGIGLCALIGRIRRR